MPKDLTVVFPFKKSDNKTDFVLAEESKRFRSRFSMEKRAHIRANYPSIGPVGGLPQVSYQGKEMIPHNLSAGGILLEDRHGLDWGDPPNFHELEFYFPLVGKKVPQCSELLRCRNEFRHFRFEPTHPDLLVEFVIAGKPSFYGQRMHRIYGKNNKNEQRWKAMTGEYLEIIDWPGRGNTHVKAFFDRKEYEFSAEDQFVKPAVVDKNVVDEMLMFMCNLVEFTEESSEVCKRLENYRLHLTE